MSPVLLSAVVLFTSSRRVCATTHGMSTTDVGVQLFRDNRCFERAGEVIWDTEGSCFVNAYDLSQSKAFTVALINSATRGSEILQLSLWQDACETPVSSGPTTVTATAGICSPVLGALYGIYSVRYRNTLTTCASDDISCSTARTLKISRYASQDCSGDAQSVKWKSADGLCVKEGTDVEKYTFDVPSNTLLYQLWRSANNCTTGVPEQTVQSVITEGCLASVGVSFYYSLLQGKDVVSLAASYESWLFMLAAMALYIIN